MSFSQSPNPLNPVPPLPQRRSIASQVAIALACAVVLTGGFIFGAFATCNFMSSHPTKWFAFFFWASIAGLAVVVLCIVFLLGLGIVRLVRGPREG